MNLKSIDIAKVKRLSLKDVKLPAQEVKAQPLQVERPPTDAEIAFNKTALNNPVFKAIAERLDLKILRVVKLLDEERRYTKREAIDQIIERVGGGLVNIKRADVIFNKMLDKGTIKETEVKDYYSLKSSTPL
jgi:RNA-binding protein YhbY